MKTENDNKRKTISNNADGKSADGRELAQLTPATGAKSSIDGTLADAKVQKAIDNLQTIIDNLPIGAEKTPLPILSAAIGAIGKGASKYARFNLLDGSRISIRLGAHNANANTFLSNKAPKHNISIVIKRRRSADKFIPNNAVHLSEYVYNRESITEDVFIKIAQGLIEAILIGEYNDYTGLAKIYTSGFEKKNSVLDNTMDTGETLTGERNDTATPQDTVSNFKGNENVN